MKSVHTDPISLMSANGACSLEVGHEHPRQAGGAAILDAEGLRQGFGGQVVLHDVSLKLHQGDVVLLRGDNGSGKTTLLNILTGNLAPDAGSLHFSIQKESEYFEFPRPWWKQLNPFNHFTPERVAREGIGRTWQELRLFRTQTLFSNVAVATPHQTGENPVWALLRLLTVRRQESAIDKQVANALAKVGLSGRGASYADQVSLGQAKRVAVMRSLQCNARILFLDEPLSGLDDSGIVEVMKLLETLVDEGVTLVIVEHVFNILRILDLANTVWTLRNGRLIVETPGDVQAELQDRADDAVHGWLCGIAGLESKIESQKLLGNATLSKVCRAEDKPGSVVLEVRDLIVYRGRRLVIGEKDSDGHIHGLSFTLRRGEIGLLEAPNGWGKTTLLEAVAGLLPYHGSIAIEGQDVRRLSPWQRAKVGVSLLQSRNNIFPHLTVEESLRLSGFTAVPADLQDFRSRRVGDLSGGEKQKVAAVCTLQGERLRVGLLDEPFSALDQDVMSTVKTLAQEHLQQAGLLLAVPKGIKGFAAPRPTGK